MEARVVTQVRVVRRGRLWVACGCGEPESPGDWRGIGGFREGAMAEVLADGAGVPGAGFGVDASVGALSVPFDGGDVDRNGQVVEGSRVAIIGTTTLVAKAATTICFGEAGVSAATGVMSVVVLLFTGITQEKV
ncbi:DUF21 domain-containing protein [Acorus calamus]|uniref:DUF21 domain-containing protein n=1 Tax=Acorus calamus TaxID=4465 RepID=A0AAV9CVU7_ACOCL|nr:DUF21 domain-containing protein [Acorus calamus]